jgi:hypothetical protein
MREIPRTPPPPLYPKVFGIYKMPRTEGWGGDLKPTEAGRQVYL